MRIISGTLRGSKLFTLEGDNTRPTLDRVKEALFSKIHFGLDEAIVLDLFSGSGALALESISRGAAKAYMCDSSIDAIKIIKQNIIKTRTQDKTVVMHCDFKKALEKLTRDGIKFNFVFLDPPYLSDAAEDAIDIIIDNKLLYDNGIIIVETDNQTKVISNLNAKKVRINEVKKYGRVYLLFLSRETLA